MLATGRHQNVSCGCFGAGKQAQAQAIDLGEPVPDPVPTGIGLGRHGIRTRAAQVDAKLEAAIRGLRLRIDMADEGTISLLARIYFDRLLAEYRSAWKPAGGEGRTWGLRDRSLGVAPPQEERCSS